MKELALLLMVFWPGGEDFVAQVQATLQDARAVWEAFADGNVCAFGNSLQRFLRNFGISITFAQENCQCPSCRFEALYAIPSPGCPPCDDDPTQCCLYCYDENGNRVEVGRYQSTDEWLTGVLEMMVRCNCVSADFVPRSDVDKCGTLGYVAR